MHVYDPLFVKVKSPEFADVSGFNAGDYSTMNEKEKELVKWMLKYPFVLGEAAERFSPAVLANYTYELAKTFNQFYHECPIVDVAAVDTTRFRLQLCQLCADLIQRALHLLGIGVPERM